MEVFELRNAEIHGLLKHRTLPKASGNSLTKDTRIFGSRFVDKLKRTGESIRIRSRLEVQNYIAE